MKSLHRFLAALVIATLILGSLPACSAYVAGFTVNSLADNTTAGDGLCTLREAIDSANNAGNGDCGANSTADDTITFGVSGTIILDSRLPNIVAANTAGKLTIDGAGQSITISGNNRVRLFSVDPNGDLTLQNLTLSDGKGIGRPGGIYNEGTVTIINSTLSGNSTTDAGGGIFNYGGTVTITNSTLSGNSTTDAGGGIFNYGGTVTITNSTLSDNSADYGGSIFNYKGTVTITNSTLLNNFAKIGGGIDNDVDSTVILTNSTLSDNSVNSFGGGIFNEGTVTITNSTLSDNSANSGGGILNFGTVTIKNSIVANSSSGGNCDDTGTFTAQGVNFATDASCPGFTKVMPAQLNLGPLQNNGGPTQTHALQSGSVAIDAATDCTDTSGSVIATDQRGMKRPQDGDGNGSAICDVGSYEADIFSHPSP